MTVFIYFIIFCVQLFDVSTGYVNLSKNKPAWQTTNYKTDCCFASAAVDGDTRQTIGSGSCALIKGTNTSGAWGVDLGKVLTINNVKIYYRSDNGVDTWRMAGFFLYVSNTTSKEDGKICFHDIQTSPPPNPMTINCTQHARYVIYYNERNRPGVTYPSSFSKYLWNEHCEVEVYGCPESCKTGSCNIATGECVSCIDGYQGTQCEKCPKGKYGSGCNDDCNTNCIGKDCHHVSGICTDGCKAGWKGNLCNDKCDEFFYGVGCKTNCGKCLDRAICNHVDGTCSTGCEAGWREAKCHKMCIAGTYGLKCNKTCNRNCYSNIMCDHVNGNCNNGCKPGWQGVHCDAVCNNHFYGANCKSPCGHCLNRTKCDHINGMCTAGCDAGWRGDKCDIKCSNGTFGFKCNQTCNKNCFGNTGDKCNHVTGNCTKGCLPGWQGTHCEQACGDFSYGQNCSFKCEKCFDEGKCHHVDGKCSNGCEKGWQGDKCDKICDPGKYGEECKESCSENCNNVIGICHHAIGNCLGECIAGWKGPYCDTKCDNRMYGQKCRLFCGNCLNYTQCDHINGTCFQGCDKGFFGENCIEDCPKTLYGENCMFNCSSECVNQTCDAKNGECVEIKPVQRAHTSTPAAAIGGAIGAILFTLLVVAAFVLFRRRNGKEARETDEMKKVYSNDSKNFSSIIYENFNTKNKTETTNKPEIEVDIETEGENADTIYANNTVKEETYPDIPVSQLEQIIIEKRQNGEDGFKQEYTSFPLGEMCPCRIGRLEHNLKKNRFKTTFPYDHSRVVIMTDGNETADYINANYIDGMENDKRRYIGSQGPKQGTVEDFWRMIWQENVTQVVMLTNLKEGIKEKCLQYWPDSPHHPFVVGRFSIQKTVEKEYGFFVVRILTVKHTELKKQRTVTQFHYTAWPDHGVPDTLFLVEFHSYVMRSESKKINSPLVVHCSAGIGRTGTYIALDALYKHGVKYGKVNIAQYVKTMRENRMNMVQTREQYITIYLTLCEAFKASVNVIPVAKFVSQFEKVMEDAPTNQNPLRKEMLMLSRIRRKYSDLDFKLAKKNCDLKETTGAVLPLDKFTLHLMTSVPNRGSYINAIQVPSFTKLNYFIVTPYPTQDTAVDLLRLVADQQSTNVVVMDPVRDIDSSTLWLPRGSSTATLEPFSITCKSVSNKDGTDTSIIQISNTQIRRKPMEVSILAPSSSISVDKGSDTSVLRELVSAVLNSDANGPVIVMSRDAASQCGLFCAVFNVIQQMRLDEEIDIVTAVRQLQVRRPEFCSSMDEYRACYQTIADHIMYSSDHIYSN